MDVDAGLNCLKGSEKAKETKTGNSNGKNSTRKFVITIVFLVFALNIGSLTLTLLTREIGATFFPDTQATVGITSQLSTIGFAAAVAAGIATSILAIRFTHKSLLLAGITFQVVSAAGSFLAPTFLWLELFFAMEGVGAVLSGVAFITLIGDFVPHNRKAKAVSYISAAVFFATFSGALTIPVATELGTWRYAYLLLALPFSAAAWVVSYFGIQSKPNSHQTAIGKDRYVGSFKQVLLNKSAVACLVASLFFSGVIGLFAINFFRQQFWFDLPLRMQVQYSSYIVMVGTLLFAIGSLVAGRLLGRIGVKTITIASAFGDGVFILLLFLSPNLWMALVFDLLHIGFAATAGTALACLALDQVPMARGTMMSLQRVFGNIGNTIAPAIGGSLLVLASYATLGVVLGGMSIIASGIILFLSKDPNRVT